MKFAVRVVPSKTKITKYTTVYIYCYYFDSILQKRIKRKIEVIGNYLELQKKNPNFLDQANERVKELQKEFKEFEQNANYYKFNKKSVNTSSVCTWGEALLFPLWNKLGLHKLLSQTFNAEVSKTVFAIVANRFILPASKKATLENLQKSLFDYDFIDKNDIYEVLDKVQLIKDRIVGSINRNINKHFKRELSIVLYDVTTIYFESFTQEEDLKVDVFDRKAFFEAITATFSTEKTGKNRRYLATRGYSKNNKRNETQVVVGLLVDSEGIPFTYEVFRGNTSEKNTLLYVVDKFKQSYNIKKIIVVADSGLNSSDNLKQLEESGYEYIVGFPPHMKLTSKEAELLLDPQDWKFVNIYDENKTRFKNLNLTRTYYSKMHGKFSLQPRFIGYFKKQYQTRKLHEISKKRYKAQTLIDKNTIPNANNYIRLINKNKTYKLNTSLIEKQIKWAGYAGIITNIHDQEPMNLINIKQGLWVIEDNFRVLKTHLKVRPIYVYSDNRIRGHILCCYISLVMVRFIQRLLRENGIDISTDMIIDVIRNRLVNPFVDDKGNKVLVFNYATKPNENGQLTSIEDQNYENIINTLGLKLNGGFVLLETFYKQVGMVLKVHKKHFINDVKKESLTVLDFIDSFNEYVNQLKDNNSKKS